MTLLTLILRRGPSTTQTTLTTLLAARRAQNGLLRQQHFLPSAVALARNNCLCDVQYTVNYVKYARHNSSSSSSSSSQAAAASDTAKVSDQDSRDTTRTAASSDSASSSSASSSSSDDAKPSSKLEETVRSLKAKQEEKLQQLSRLEDLKKEVKSLLERDEEQVKVIDDKSRQQQVDVVKKSLWVRFVDEIKHYYSGFKLLFLDVKVSTKIVWKVCKGRSLSRRESKQLVRTVSDLFRLVPFSVFVIVPFMEFLLPVALKLFPGLLPSTFTTSSDRESKMRRTLKAKLEYAKFLQKTLDEMAPASSDKARSSKSARDFVEFYRKVKQGEIQVRNEDIKKFSPLFEDEITLDNMTRGQLVALCKMLELTPLGTSNFLRFQLEMKIKQLHSDDLVIQREGLDNMDVQELQNACKERGMRAYGLSSAELKRQLEGWLELSIDANIPPSLLLLSRTLYLPDNVDATAQIAATISSLPESAAEQTTATIGEREGKVRNVMQLKIIQDEQRKIEEEEAEAKEMEAKAKAIKKAIDDEISGTPESLIDTKIIDEPPSVQKMVKELQAVVGRATVSSTGEMREASASLGKRMKEAESVEVLKEEISKALTNEPEVVDAMFSTEDLGTLKRAMETLGKTRVEDEEEIGQLKKELQDYEEDLEELNLFRAEAERLDLQESKGARRLFAKVNRMLGKVDNLVSSLESQRKEIEAITHSSELSESERSQEESKLVTIHELIEAVKQLQSIPDSKRLEQIAEVLKKLDEDADGVIKVDHVMKVIELLGTENIELSSKQMDKIIDMLEKEEMPVWTNKKAVQEPSKEKQ